MPPPALDVEALLAHAGWIRSLARRLVADANRADDLVQRTFVAALDHPPEASTPLRRWLAAVVRNFARQDRRTDRRRIEREAATARVEAIPSAHESVDAIAIQRELFEAVLALDEPYRTTVVQRFYEGLPPREIARRQGIPVKTVKTRLSRALEKLRASLDLRHKGDREAWLPALLPLAAAPALPASALWSLLVDTKIKIGIAAVALAGVAAVAFTLDSKPERQPAPAALTAAPDAPLEIHEHSRGIAASGATAGRETLPEEAAPKERALPPGHPIVGGIARGRVIDVDGNAVAGVSLVLVPHGNGISLEVFRSAEESRKDPVATSGGDGTFEMKTRIGGGTLLAGSATMTTVFAADVSSPQAGVQEDLVVVVAPRGGLGGVVVTQEGSAVFKAEVFVRVDRSILSGLTGVADRSFEIPWRAITDEVGKFEIPAAPAIDGATIVTSATGYALDHKPVPEVPALDLRIVLQRLDKTFPQGEVVDARGHPVEGALVSCNLSSTRTDTDGRFTIDVGRQYFEGLGPYEKDEIVAVKEGLLPARFAKPEGGWPAFVTLTLGGEPLEIRGRVVDESGAGIPNAEVWTPDEHGFGVVVEDVGNTGIFRSMESLLRGGQGMEMGTTTDREGAFVLRGLLAGDYRVVCMENRTLLHAELPSVPAGSRDVRLVLAGRKSCVRVAGRVVSRLGKPVGGLTLHAGVRLSRWPYGNDPPFAIHGDSTTTDAEGRFAFETLSAEGLSLQLISPNLLVVDWKPPLGAKLGDLEIQVALRCHVQVDLGDRPDSAESFVVLDGAGAKVEALEYRGPMAMVHDPVPIELGRSPVVAITEDAKLLVLSKGGQEVARFPLSLAPGELKIVRP